MSEAPADRVVIRAEVLRPAYRHGFINVQAGESALAQAALRPVASLVAALDAAGVVAAPSKAGESLF